jgi:hypothetical protein
MKNEELEKVAGCGMWDAEFSTPRTAHRVSRAGLFFILHSSFFI